MSQKFYDGLQKNLDTLKQAGTYKYLKYIDSPMDAHAAVGDAGDKIILCSNNYIGLSNKPEIIEAAHKALDKYGAGAASVRFICGTFTIHEALEKKTAEFLKTEAALSYTSCWNANGAIIPAILSAGDCVISDELNHASIIDSCRHVAKDVKRMVYRHADMKSLEERLIEAKDCKNVLVVTDGVFSMEGDIAPLPQIVELMKKYGAILMVDDSHATGVIGKTGRGTAEFYNMEGSIDIISGTYGKALGGAGGGFIAAKQAVIDTLIQKSRPSLFSNSLPPVLSAIALASVTYLDEHPEIVTSLHKKVEYMREEILKLGIKPLEGDSAIIPIIVHDTAKAISIADKMFVNGVYAIGFGFPVVPEGEARIRIQVSDSLSYADIDKAVAALKLCF